MNILISGCSFTQWPETPGGRNSCWPRYLQDLLPNDKIKSLAEGAAGNQYICESIIRSTIESRPDHVLVMWSGVSRLDYLTSLENPAWDEMFTSYNFFRRLPPGDKLGYIFSGGGIGTWYNHPVGHKMFNEMYKVSSELSLGTINLMEIIKLQAFLQSKNIPYHFMSYINYWNDRERVSPNGDFGVYRYKELLPLINEIDFSRWIFKNEQRDGLYEIALETDDFQDDGFHPDASAHQAWADIVFNTISRT